jgi:hypothetical protein
VTFESHTNLGATGNPIESLEHMSLEGRRTGDSDGERIRKKKEKREKRKREQRRTRKERRRRSRRR